MFAQSLIEYGALAGSRSGGGPIDEISGRIRAIAGSASPETWAIVGGVAILALLLWKRRSSRF